MKKVTLFILIAVLFITLCSCGSNDSARNTESGAVATEPTPQLVYLLTQQRMTTYTDGTSSMLIIKNSFDENNRKISSSQSYNGEETVQTTFDNYDQHGNCTLYTMTTAEGEQFIYDVVYTYDEFGNFTKMEQTVTMAIGEIYETTTMTRIYDGDGNLTTESMIRDNTMHDIADYQYRNEYSYDGNGHAVRCVTYDGNGDITNSETYFCDENGNIVLAVGDSGAMSYRTYDETGNIVSVDVCRAGELLSSTTYSYNVVEEDPVSTTSPIIHYVDYSSEQSNISTLLETYFSAIQNMDEDAFTSLLAKDVKTIIAEEGFDASGYFQSVDFIYECCSDAASFEWTIDNIGFNESATVFTELNSEIAELTSELGIETDLTASVVISLRSDTNHIECIAFLYQANGNWYYLLSLPLQLQ